MILAGDVGGTKVHLALYDFAGGRLKLVRDDKFPSHEYASLDAAVNAFLGDGGGGTNATTEILSSAQNDGPGGVAACAARSRLRALAARGRCAMDG